MYIVENYQWAVVLCFITMLCWGSWGNTQKLASKSWRYEYFYWDYVIGIVLCSLLFAFTLGSIGTEGRSFIPDLSQATLSNVGLAFLGGIVFNAANILLSSAIAVCGMSVAFPVGVGFALVLGVIVNYVAEAKGDPSLLFVGVALIAVAIICNGLAYGKMNKQKALSAAANANGGADKAGAGSSNLKKGIFLSLASGIIMAFFFRFVAASVDLQNFAAPAEGKMTPYTAVFIFSLGVFLSTFIFNSYAMRHPVQGEPIKAGGYFKGSFPTHMVGILGGCIWCVGESLSMIAAGKAGAAISYGLGQGATLVSALWGIVIWKEFKGAPRSSHVLNLLMFVLFILGLILLIMAGA